MPKTMSQVLAEKRAELTKPAADAIAADGGEAMAFSADITDPDQAQGAVAACVARFGKVTTLANVAASLTPSSWLCWAQL